MDGLWCFYFGFVWILGILVFMLEGRGVYVYGCECVSWRGYHSTVFVLLEVEGRE